MSKIITPTPVEWDAFVRAQPRAHVLQLAAWGELKAAYGWGVARVALTDMDGRITAGAQVLTRRLPARLGSMAYVGMGPYVTGTAPAKALWKTIQSRVTRSHKAAFLKWEPGIYAPDEPQPDCAAAGFVTSAQTVQPPRTVLVDLNGDEEAILARMNQGTRRKIRQSLKNDIRYYEASAADVRKFTDLMQVTGTRNEFGVHEPGYYALAHRLFVQETTPPDAALILAEHEGDTLAGVFVFALGKTAWYFYGASSDVKRNLMASYGVQWTAMLWAKARGCTVYDLWGIPDEDEATLEAQFQQRGDGLWGVYGFKRGWGGQVVRSLGAWDKAYNPLIYQAYRAAVWWQDFQAGG